MIIPNNQNSNYILKSLRLHFLENKHRIKTLIVPTAQVIALQTDILQKLFKVAPAS